VEIAASGGAGPEFAACVEIVPAATAASVAPSALSGLIQDPRTTAGLAAVVALQQRVVEFCDSTQNHIALIDVPPGLSQGRIEQWRAAFDSSWVAGYHPWLIPTRRNEEGSDSGQALRRQLPPSAVAAGIVARREFERGIQYGPANEIAREVIHVAEAQPAGRADALHPQNINCFVRQPDGIGLVAARTLSRESDWRQLSVRRLILMLRRTLLVETQWAVFEPNGPALWRDLQHAIESLLRGLFRVGAFAGRTEAESFFVRMHTDRLRLDRGELLVEIGVAPAEPLEFILVRLRRDGDGTLNLEA
jgi:phage tail sheath protein FI